jgi:hypothetical protein
MWGMMIGEMFDLEALAKQCEEKQRWSFFFMSSPMNVPGKPSTRAYGFIQLTKLKAALRVSLML